MPVFCDQTSMLKFIRLMKKKYVYCFCRINSARKRSLSKRKLKEANTVSFGKSRYTR